MRAIVVVVITIIFLGSFFMLSPKYFWQGRQKEKQVEPNEWQLIGRVSGYNPRVKDIQAILSGQGIEVGETDGYIGQKTRNGIKKLQQANNLKVTGIIDSATLSALKKIKPAFSHVDTEELSVKTAEEEKTTDIHDGVLNYRLQSKERVKKIQMALQKAGYYKGEIDVKLGPRTKRAIKEFQKAKKLNPDGIVGEKTWEALSQYLKE